MNRYITLEACSLPGSLYTGIFVLYSIKFIL